MAYYTLFAFVPALSSVFFIYACVVDPTEISNHISKISRFIAAESQEMLKGQLTALSSKENSDGIGAIGALLFALWSASKGSKAVMEAMNIIYEEKEKRGFFKFNLMALAMTFVATLLSILAIGVIIGIPPVTSLFNFGPLIEVRVTVLSWLVLLRLFTVFLSFAYRYCPSRAKAH